jgi:hypothetical protein
MKNISNTFSPSTVAAVALITLAALAGCSTTSSGMGGGELNVKGKPDTPVLFSWQSQDGGISGSMVATLPATTFQGSFVQITQQTVNESLAPMWVGWNTGWSDWPYWTQPFAESYDVTRFTRYYSGKVVANLRAPSGQIMRCRFNLDEPASGMAGGGQGECQLAGGRTVNAVIDRKS